MRVNTHISRFLGFFGQKRCFWGSGPRGGGCFTSTPPRPSPGGGGAQSGIPGSGFRDSGKPGSRGLGDLSGPGGLGPRSPQGSPGPAQARDARTPDPGLRLRRPPALRGFTSTPRAGALSPGLAGGPIPGSGGPSPRSREDLPAQAGKIPPFLTPREIRGQGPAARG